MDIFKCQNNLLHVISEVSKFIKFFILSTLFCTYLVLGKNPVPLLLYRDPRSRKMV